MNLVDTSILSSFSVIRRMDLLQPWEPLDATNRVLAEISASKWGSVRAGVEGARREGWLRVAAEGPSDGAMRRVLSADRPPLLSDTDAELLALSVDHGALLLADDRRMRRIGEALEVVVLTVDTTLLALKKEGFLATRAAMLDVVQSLEDKDRRRKFDPGVRTHLLRFP